MESHHSCGSRFKTFYIFKVFNIFQVWCQTSSRRHIRQQNNYHNQGYFLCMLISSMKLIKPLFTKQLSTCLFLPGKTPDARSRRGTITDTGGGSDEAPAACWGPQYESPLKRQRGRLTGRTSLRYASSSFSKVDILIEINMSHVAKYYCRNIDSKWF